MNNEQLTNALYHYNKTVNGSWMVMDTYESLIWYGDPDLKPSEVQLQECYNEYLENKLKEKYKEDRVNEYPSIQDQLDMIYHDKVNGTNIWQDSILAIKIKYPKP